MSQIRTAVIGNGYWGSKIVRNVAFHPEYDLIAVSDMDFEKSKRTLESLGLQGVKQYIDVDQLLSENEIDFVIIALPPEHHFENTIKALQNNCHVLIEKPLGINYEDKVKLVEKAASLNKLIFCDHTYLFTPEFRKVNELIKSNDIGELNYFHSMRVNLGLLQENVSVVEDLMIHDLAILEVLNSSLPKYVSCIGSSISPSKQVSTAFATLKYEDGFIANLTASWNSPVKIREIQISGDNGMLIWDDNVGAEKIKVYNSEIKVESSAEKKKVSYHLGEGRIISVIGDEALKCELDLLSNALRQLNNNFITGSRHILRTSLVLAALTDSLKNSGKLVEVVNYEN